MGWGAEEATMMVRMSDMETQTSWGWIWDVFAEFLCVRGTGVR